MAVVSAIVSAVIIFMGIIPQAYAKQTELDQATVIAKDAQVRVSTLEGKVIGIGDVSRFQLKSDMGSYVSQSAVSGAQTDAATAKASAGAATTQVTSIQTTVAALQSQLNTLIAQVNAQNVTIQNLQSGTSGGTVTNTGLVKASFAANSWVQTSYTPGNGTVQYPGSPNFQLPFKLTVTNGLNKQITDLQLFVSMYAQGAGTAGATATMQSLSGGAWTVYASGNPYLFTNVSGMSTWGGTGLTVPANSSATLTLIFNYTAPTTAYGSLITFTPDVAPIDSTSYTVTP